MPANHINTNLVIIILIHSDKTHLQFIFITLLHHVAKEATSVLQSRHKHHNFSATIFLQLVIGQSNFDDFNRTLGSQPWLGSRPWTNPRTRSRRQRRPCWREGWLPPSPTWNGRPNPAPWILTTSPSATCPTPSPVWPSVQTTCTLPAGVWTALLGFIVKRLARLV